MSMYETLQGHDRLSVPIAQVSVHVPGLEVALSPRFRARHTGTETTRRALGSPDRNFRNIHMNKGLSGIVDR